MTTDNISSELADAFPLTLTFSSDWHVGSGAGRPGDIDRLVQRDADGFPYVPAKHLTGLWRDACELAAFGLDRGSSDGGWSRWVGYLFGDQPGTGTSLTAAPRPAALSLAPARLPEALRSCLIGRPMLQEALTFVKPGVAIDSAAGGTGRAKPKHLRFIQMARSGMTLEAQAEWTMLAPPEAARALLVAGALLLERLGGKRRRGAGRCRLSLLDGEALCRWLDWLDAHHTPDEPPEAQKDETKFDSVSPEEGAWTRYDLTLTAQQPLVIPLRTVGNLRETADFVPGTVLLPLVTRVLGDAVRQAVASGELVVTHAALEMSGMAGRPVPAALFYQKMNGGLPRTGKTGKHVFNRLCEGVNGPQVKGFRSGWVGKTSPGTLPPWETVPQGTHTHNTIQDDVQRPTSDVGGVYTYQTIAPGTRLRAQLRLHPRFVPNGVSHLAGPHTLGSSKKDDYGAVTIAVQPAGPPEVPAVRDTLTVWLLSDLLLRDGRLRPTASLSVFAAVLGEALGVSLTVRPADDQNKLPSAIARQRRTDSWHRGWNLPRPSLVGLAAGTCVVFTVTGTVTADKLAEVAERGLGERRAEGFGQMSFNDPLLTSALAHQTGDALVAAEPPVPVCSLLKGHPQFQAVRALEEIAWRQAIERGALGLAATKKGRQDALGLQPGSHTQSQLGALRSILGRLSADERRVLEWMDKSERKNGDQRWAGAKALVDTKKIKVWELLKFTADFCALMTTTQNAEDELKTKLWAEAVRAVADACIRAHTREGETADGPQD